jgi:hypothetical protein
VIVLLENEPVLLGDLIHLSRIRMHLIALALAHVDGELPQDIGRILFRGSAGNRPIGLKRVALYFPHVNVADPASLQRKQNFGYSVMQESVSLRRVKPLVESYVDKELKRSVSLITLREV